MKVLNETVLEGDYGTKLIVSVNKDVVTIQELYSERDNQNRETLSETASLTFQLKELPVLIKVLKNIRG
jgi:hypothetical protein